MRARAEVNLYLRLLVAVQNRLACSQRRHAQSTSCYKELNVLGISHASKVCNRGMREKRGGNHTGERQGGLTFTHLLCARVTIQVSHAHSTPVQIHGVNAAPCMRDQRWLARHVSCASNTCRVQGPAVLKCVDSTNQAERHVLGVAQNAAPWAMSDCEA